MSLSAGVILVLWKSLPLCCYPELAVYRYSRPSAHHNAIQQGDVRHVHSAQHVIQRVLRAEEAAESQNSAHLLGEFYK